MGLAKFIITATPKHKEVPYNDLSEQVICSDGILTEETFYVVTSVISNVRKRGHDMRDDWTIVLSFRSAA